MNDTTTDARVTTLTAEVRTLMVGSRQVTLSIYGQLDEVPLMAMSPFGRVRTRDKFAEGWEVIQVVGADRDGRLVASRLSWLEARDTYKDPGGRWANRADGGRTWSDLMNLPLIVLAGLR